MDWQPIENYEGRYEVSTGGAVRRVGGGSVGQWKNHNGYMIVRLSRPRAQFRVHRLVAAAFLTNPNRLPIVNHLDHDRVNNSAGNLEWCTQKQNLDHAAKAGRLQRDYWRGRRSPNAALTDKAVRDIRRLYSEGNLSWEAIGQQFGVCKRSIGRVVNHESYCDV